MLKLFTSQNQEYSMVVGKYRISAVESENAALPVFRVIDKFSFPAILREPEHLEQIPLKLLHIKGFQGDAESQGHTLLQLNQPWDRHEPYP